MTVAKTPRNYNRTGAKKHIEARTGAKSTLKLGRAQKTPWSYRTAKHTLKLGPAQKTPKARTGA